MTSGSRAWLAAVMLWGVVHAWPAAATSSDEPEHARDPLAPFKAASSYEDAVRVWRTPEDIAGWIAANFSYDAARAQRLSETERALKGPLAIHAPPALFATGSGVCVDLARFGVETLRRIDPRSRPRYLMIEFDPIRLAGNTVRRHWVATFTRDGKTYVFADSKRPGHIAGPYADVSDFARDYERYRDRTIVALREVDSYEKRRKARAPSLTAGGIPKHGD